MTNAVRLLGKERVRDQMSRLTTMERVSEIERQLPEKHLGCTRYYSRQYNQIEEMVGLCRKMHKQLESARSEVRSLRKGDAVTKTASVADLINQLHNEARGTAIDAVNKACDCGDLLREQKEDVEHGGWEKWVEDNCHFSMRTARNYMKAGKVREENGGVLPFSSLAGLYGPAPDVPDKVAPEDAIRETRPTPTQLQADVLNINNALEEMQLPLMSADALVSEAGTEILTEKAHETMDWLVDLHDMLISASDGQVNEQEEDVN